MDAQKKIILGLFILSMMVLAASCDSRLKLKDSAFASPHTTGLISSRPVTVTDGIKHSVALDEIEAGGPKKDGIPSIDKPEFMAAREAKKFLDDQDKGIAVVFNKEVRFYPYLVLVWHEIVNDRFRDRDILVTYCPLCESGIVYDPNIGGQILSFGTSGKLWNSNLLMYDRKTGTMWSQILGEAVHGPLTGQKLAIIKSDQMDFGQFRKLHPRGKVLTTNTGHKRPYGKNPYSGYETVSAMYFHLTNYDNRIHPKRLVFGVFAGGETWAVKAEDVKEKGSIEEKVGNVDVLAKWEQKHRSARIYGKQGTKEYKPMDYMTSYWACWAAAYPGTLLYGHKQ